MSTPISDERLAEARATIENSLNFSDMLGAASDLLDEVERLRAELAETTSCHRCGTHKMRGATADYPELCKTCGEYMSAEFGKPRTVNDE